MAATLETGQFHVAELGLTVIDKQVVDIQPHYPVDVDGVPDFTQLCLSRTGNALLYPTLDPASKSGAVQCTSCWKLWS